MQVFDCSTWSTRCPRCLLFDDEKAAVAAGGPASKALKCAIEAEKTAFKDRLDACKPDKLRLLKEYGCQ